MTRALVPHLCPQCCDETVETEDGVVPNYYGTLYPKDPPTCPNCGGRLVALYDRTKGLTDRPRT